MTQTTSSVSKEWPKDEVILLTVISLLRGRHVQIILATLIVTITYVLMGTTLFKDNKGKVLVSTTTTEVKCNESIMVKESEDSQVTQ